MAATKTCYICNNEAAFCVNKYNVDYHQCFSCKTIFCDPLDQDEMVGGTNETPRNEQFNPLRLQRIQELYAGGPKPKILDWGCGSGMYVDFMRGAGYDVDGFDPYNPKYDQLPKPDSYDLVNMCEVIEHLSSPFIEIKAIARSMKRGAVLVVETSFVNCMAEDGFTPESFFYLDPRVGHSTLFSHHSIDLLMVKNGLHPLQHTDRNVRVYIKQTSNV
jgi:SAM-dependent methyltransferase